LWIPFEKIEARFQNNLPGATSERFPAVVSVSVKQHRSRSASIRTSSHHRGGRLNSRTIDTSLARNQLRLYNMTPRLAASGSSFAKRIAAEKLKSFVSSNNRNRRDTYESRKHRYSIGSARSSTTSKTGLQLKLPNGETMANFRQASRPSDVLTIFTQTNLALLNSTSSWIKSLQGIIGREQLASSLLVYAMGDAVKKELLSGGGALRCCIRQGYMLAIIIIILLLFFIIIFFVIIFLFFIISFFFILVIIIASPPLPPALSLLALSLASS
jgi:hypothetical protein